MCGIAGFNLSDEDWANLNIAKIVRSLGLDIESRGRDATGLLTVANSGRVAIKKAPTNATQFLYTRPGIGCSARLALIHTRAATQGKPEKEFNNHPISYGHIHGIHNGHIDNDYALFRDKKWKRIGEVDSEIIFASLYHSESEPLALEALQGWMAVAWISEEDPFTLKLAKGFASPLHLAMTPGKSLFFASTSQALMTLVDDQLVPPWEWMLEASSEGVIYSFNPTESELIIRRTFTPKERVYIPHTRYGGGGWEWGADWDYDMVTRRISGQELAPPDLSPVIDVKEWEPKLGERVRLHGRKHMVGTVQFYEPATGETLIEWEPSVEDVESLEPLRNEEFTQACIDRSEVAESLIYNETEEDDDDDEEITFGEQELISDEEWNEIMLARWAEKAMEDDDLTEIDRGEMSDAFEAALGRFALDKIDD